MTEPENNKQLRAEEMTAKELRDHIKHLTPGDEFRVSTGVYIYCQADGALSYFVRLYYKGKHEYWNHASQVEAESFYASRIAEMERCKKQGVAWDPERDKKRTQVAIEKAQGLTVEEFGEWWYTNIVSIDNGHSTQRKYRENLGNHVYPYFDYGNRPMRSITEEDIEGFARYVLAKINPRTKRTLKVSTAHSLLRMLWGFFCQAKKKNVIEQMPTTKTNKELAGVKEPPSGRPFTAAEEAILLAGILRYEPEWHPHFLLLLRSMMRTGESLALIPDDLNFDTRKIIVRETFSEGKIGPTKTKKVRIIDMSEELALALLAYLIRRREEELIRGIQFTYLFGWEADRPIAMRTFQGLFNGLRDFLGLPDRVLYCTRHTGITRLLTMTSDYEYIKTQAGHASIQTTIDLYGHLVPRVNKLVDRLDAPGTPTRVVAPEPAGDQPPHPVPLWPQCPSILAESGIKLSDALIQFERDMIEQALERTKGNRKAAAALLGMHYDTLLARLCTLRRHERDSPPEGGAMACA